MTHKKTNEVILGLDDKDLIKLENYKRNKKNKMKTKRIKKLEGGEVVLMKNGTKQYILFNEHYSNNCIVHQSLGHISFEPATLTPKNDFFSQAVKIISRSSYDKR